MTRSKRDGPDHYWVDGAVVRFDDPHFDSALLDQPGSYSTAIVNNGRVRWADRHVRRLRRDARARGLTPPSQSDIAESFEHLARAEFGEGRGVVRMQVVATRDGSPFLFGVPRPLGADHDVWRAAIAPFPHGGPGPRLGAKMLGLDWVEQARAWLSDRPFDEVLLYDAAGHLVEGSRSNLLLVTEAGRACFPDPALGSVAGIGLEIACEKIPDLSAVRLTRADVARAREVVAVNAVRGARPVVRLDDKPVGDGGIGELGEQLQTILGSNS